MMKGFTLIEMMIVVAIIVILAAMVIPYISGNKPMNSQQAIEMGECKQVTTPTRKYWECNK